MAPSSEDPLLTSEEDLLYPFRKGAKGDPHIQLLGTESEKFGVLSGSLKPVSYDGTRCGIVNIFDRLLATGRWTAYRERAGGPIMALDKSDHSGVVVSLEPGAQLELSGAPVRDVHEVEAELSRHLDDIAPISKECGMKWLAVGYHPLATPEQLPWVPKERYSVMKAYFPEVGTRGLDMMRRTCTVQVNVDYHSEEDAMRKMRVGLKLSVIATAIFANSPFTEGKPNGMRSERAHVWLDTDRYRTGLIPSLQGTKTSFSDYIEWALDMPIYLLKRQGKIIRATDQTFRQFMADGRDGHRATRGDWVHHLNTLFPEVRLQKTIELRSCDGLPARYLPALPAFWCGLLYDETSLQAADELMAPFSADQLEALRPEVARLALQAPLGSGRVQDVAKQAIQLALDGLGRRARHDGEGRDEGRHLLPIAELVERGLSPACALLADLPDDADALRSAIVERCAVEKR
ncbi:MAG: glutamate-cysteine ligase family protein [Myxococcota bacterium]